MAPAPLYGYPHSGQALRGSSEFHAWGDSNLYLRRLGNELALTVEHRAAPSIPTVTLELAQRGDALALERRAHAISETPVPSTLDERIVNALRDANRALPILALRTLCRVRKATFHTRLTELTTSGRLVRTTEGYRLSGNE